MHTIIIIVLTCEDSTTKLAQLEKTISKTQLGLVGHCWNLLEGILKAPMVVNAEDLSFYFF